MTTVTALPELSAWVSTGWTVKASTGNHWRRDGRHMYVAVRTPEGRWKFCIGGKHWSPVSLATAADAKAAMYVERSRLRAAGVEC